MAGRRGSVTGVEADLLSTPLVAVAPPPRNEANILAELDAPAVVVGAVEPNEDPNEDPNGEPEGVEVFVEGAPKPKELAAVVEEAPNPEKPANLDTGAASVCHNQSTSR